MTSANSIEQLLNTMMQLRRLVFQRTDDGTDEKTTTMLQFWALNFLKGQSSVTVGELARFLHMSKSSATQLSERLVKMELLSRVNDENDRRSVNLTLTAKGEEELVNLKKKVLTKMSRFFSKLPEKDIKEMTRINADLIEIIKNS